jgi:hypothetical protein
MSGNIKPTPDLLRVRKSKTRPEGSRNSSRSRRQRYYLLSLERMEELADRGGFRFALRALLKEAADKTVGREVDRFPLLLHRSERLANLLPRDEQRGHLLERPAADVAEDSEFE